MAGHQIKLSVSDTAYVANEFFILDLDTIAQFSGHQARFSSCVAQQVAFEVVQYVEVFITNMTGIGLSVVVNSLDVLF